MLVLQPIRGIILRSLFQFYAYRLCRSCNNAGKHYQRLRARNGLLDIRYCTGYYLASVFQEEKVAASQSKQQNHHQNKSFISTQISQSTSQQRDEYAFSGIR